MKTTGLLSFTATNDWLDDLAALCPDHQFAFDADARPFEPLRAVQVRNALAPYGPSFFEEPIRPQDVEASRPLKAKLRVPPVTGECLHDRFKVLDPCMTKDGCLELRQDRPGWGVGINGKYLEIDRYMHWHRKLPMRPDGSTGYT